MLAHCEICGHYLSVRDNETRACCPLCDEEVGVVFGDDPVLFSYCVNTFTVDDVGLHPVQLYGAVSATCQKDAIQRLIDTGKIYARGYEFLELKPYKADVSEVSNNA